MTLSSGVIWRFVLRRRNYLGCTTELSSAFGVAARTRGSRKSCVYRTRAATVSHVLRDVESGLGASSPDRQRFTNHIEAGCVLSSEHPIRVEHKRHRFLQI